MKRVLLKRLWRLFTRPKAHLFMMDYAETLLCNANPMSHCSQEDWDKAVTNYRNLIHGTTR